MILQIIITFLIRLALVLLFFPFSALDKILNFSAATAQAKQAVSSASAAKSLIVGGLFIEVVMSLGVLSGVADRLAGLILAGYCAITALLWKQFWRDSSFALVGESAGRQVFWDFLKNFAVAGGFLMVTFGPNARAVDNFFASPLSFDAPLCDGGAGA